MGQEVFNISRVGSGRVERFSISRGSGRIMTREIRVTRGPCQHDPRVVYADLRVEPADLTSGFAFSNLYIAACRRVHVVVPTPRGSDARIRPADAKKMQNSPLSA